MPPPASPADGDAPSRSHPSRLLRELGLSPRKAFGQNFLHDGNVSRKIVALARAEGPPFLEIGPGLGALTELLAEGGDPVTAVEVDRGLAARLRERAIRREGGFAGGNAEVVEGDFLEVPPEEWLRRFPGGATAVGNLPYSLSSPMVLRLLELREIFPRAVLMLQREVVDRLCAPPGGKEYGILSVYLAVMGEARFAFPVRRSCFTPAPEVDSAVFTIRFRRGIADDFVESLRAVTRAAFARRRKTLRNAPAPAALPGGDGGWEALLVSAGIDPGARAETVPPEGYGELARRYREAVAGRRGGVDGPPRPE
jgi:16S rRNA (adenine1518-N6/adenine1519-N6)-dimethyltransferase